MKVHRLAARLIDPLIRRVFRRLPATELCERAALWWGYRVRPGRGRVKLRGGAVLDVEPSEYVGLVAYYLGVFEPHVVRVLRSLLKPGDAAIDVGANIGLHTLEMAMMVGGGGQVLAFEPCPRNLVELRANVALNSVPQVAVVDKALGETAATGTLRLSSGANRGMYTLGDVQEVGEHFEVPIVTLDDAVNGIARRVRLIKIDVEGFELAVLRGARRLIHEVRPTLILEVNQTALARAHASPRQLWQHLTECGYECWRLDRSGPIAASCADEQGCAEYLFVHGTSRDVAEKLGLGN